MRPSVMTTLMDVAKSFALRSTCGRRKVGAVIVDANNFILSAGYNGVPSGYPHCTEVPCPGFGSASGTNLDVCEALHAEQNAIARLREPFEAHTMYCTTAPCISCTKLISATTIRVIISAEPYALSGKNYWLSLDGLATHTREWVDYDENFH